MITTLAVHDTGWMAKRGQLGIAGEEHYREEFESMNTNLHAEELKRAFKIGETEYGRADYALVSGTPQIYEINTNPSIGRVFTHPHVARIESSKTWERNFAEALSAIDAPPGAAIQIDDKMLAKQRKRDWLLTRSRWVI